MTEKRRIIALVIILAMTIVIVGSTAITLLYRAAITEETTRLIETAQSRARLIEAIARHENAWAELVHPEGAEAATLAQVIEGHEEFIGFGKTGEFTLAHREKDSIVFLLSHRHSILTTPKSVPFYSDLAEPMRYALQGESGSLVGLDYRGTQVLAAYEPVQFYGWGIVAKIDMVEVNAPFIRASLISSLVMLLVIVIGTFSFFRISNPILLRLTQYSKDLESQIEERSKVEDRLRNSEHNFRNSIDNSPLGTAIIDGLGKLVYVNQAHLDIWDYNSLEELKAIPRKDRYLPQSYDGLEERLRKRQKDESFSPNYEMTIIRKDGKLRQLETSTSTVLWDGEKRYQILYRDITERKQAEEYRDWGHIILKILNEQGDVNDSIQSVIDVFKSQAGFDAVGIRLQDGDDFPYFIQKGFSEDFLLTENTLVERSTDGGLCRDENGNVNLECTCGLVISGKADPANPLFTQGGSAWTNDSFPILDIPSSDDPRLHPRNECIHRGYASIALIPIRNRDKIVGLIQLNDQQKGRFSLTTIEKLEEIASQIGLALMHKQAEEREYQLQQELITTSRLATVGEMASGIAHEINNPLTSVLGFADLLAKKDLPEDIRKEVNIIYDGAQRVASVTNRMLTFSRQNKTEQTMTSINSIIETTLSMRSYEMESSNIKVTTEFDSDLPETIADTGQIQQVFLNIILNAETEMRKAHQGGNLTVKTERINDTIRISFKDDGPGISEKNLDKIFNPFFTTREVGEGTGLGLSVSYGIVTQHNGKIYAQSISGRGATFIVELPVVTKAEQLKLDESATVEKKKISGAKILVVDDEPMVQDSLNEMCWQPAKWDTF